MLSSHGVDLTPSRIQGRPVAQVVFAPGAQGAHEHGFRIRNIVILQRGAQSGCRGGTPLHLCYISLVLYWLTQDFLVQVFLWINYPQAPEKCYCRIISNFLKICVNICKSLCTTSISDTAGKCSPTVPLVLLIPVANLPPPSTTPVAVSIHPR